MCNTAQAIQIKKQYFSFLILSRILTIWLNTCALDYIIKEIIWTTDKELAIKSRHHLSRQIFKQSWTGCKAAFGAVMVAKITKQGVESMIITKPLNTIWFREMVFNKDDFDPWGNIWNCLETMLLVICKPL